MNYYEIADFNPIRSDFTPPSEFVPIRRYSPEEVLSQEAIDKFTALGFKLREVQLFTTPPHKITGIHIDGNEFVSKSAINYVVNGPGIMKWYSLKHQKDSSLTTDAGTVYMPFTPSECVETDSLAITKLTLVEVCQPHNIVNDTNDFRYCFSIRYNNDSKFEVVKEMLAHWK